MTIQLSARAHAWWTMLSRKLRDERGVSELTQNLIILGAVVVIAGVVVSFMTGFVNNLIAGIGAP